MWETLQTPLPINSMRRDCMEQQVILKSNRYGINLILNENLPFEELLDAIILKFHESDKFFKNARIAINFSWRHQTT